MLRVRGRDVGVAGELPTSCGGEFGLELGTFLGGQLVGLR